ncbi:hypothetical protein DUT90_08765 [Polaribacter sp. WD7]|uniref:hypothetical protein n=1 Tax=Polaribacter sp. WD7 TaxID=2269061 RepID=UPI000DF2289F|nr:hypothetical protein [Polaribacter sp. WD7]RCS27185.1 hypothetical protein DUT90_08765 [Polaribacter sp. WD7]
MKRKLSLMYYFLVLSTISFSQKNNVFENLIEEKMGTYELKQYPEKVFIHTDKNTYLAGEDIWFSGYLINAVTHRESTKSLVLHVELISPTDSIIATKKLLMTDINSAGDFKLDKKAKAGVYTIRAYTNYMRNFESTSFFIKKIYVIPDVFNDSKTINTTQNSETINNENKNKIEKPILNFYPEGGYLVNNLKSKVAVKLKGNGLDSLKPLITIEDNTGKQITTFTTYKFGLGFFIIKPNVFKTYVAKLTLADVTYTYQLPEILQNGHTLNVRKKRQELLINLETNLEKGLFGSTVVIHQRGKLIFKNTVYLSQKKGMLKIPLLNFNSGVVNITLFNAEHNPVSERLYFVNNVKQHPFAKISTQKDFFTSRKKVNLNISLTDSLQQNIPANLSLTVKKATPKLQKNTSHNIKSWLLLSSDIKGDIKNADYFFEKNKDSKREYLLDLVMMSNGWRGFTWQKLLNNNSVKNTYKIEKGITISGKTLDKKQPYGIKSAATRLSLKGGNFVKQMEKRSDTNGEFSYGPYVFFDTISVFIEARLTNFKSKDKKLRNISIVPNTAIASPKIAYDSVNITNFKYADYVVKYQKYLASLNSDFEKQDNVLDEVIIKARLKTKQEAREKQMKERASYGNTFFRYDIATNGISGAITLLDLFANSPRIDVNYSNESIRVVNEGVPLLLLDEIPIEMEDLNFLDAEDISFYDVLIGPLAARFTSSQPVVSIYTKSGNGFISNVKRSPGIIDFNLAGFYTAREFYNTDHENGFEEQTKPDLRTTLYWNPKISTTKDNEFSFFTSDVKTSYIIELQGITSKGVPIYETKEIYIE